ncbi:MerR family transcriptional regulator [Paenibacillus agricola]|uniref:MerR family transcriptional regulator n=1 Tax=Paenibacillus agricola TaxID=2716264 RepID=A0ABX0JCW9_9BACL|nr:MerR family transcriptional regulator [Paenibacillus agricola]NHN33408.1 MerR family transcriptional regulator [Paenibacillus agricola]
MGESFSIKQISEQSGISEDTIRYYEKIQLLPPAMRKGNGHRMYSLADLQVMHMITCLKKTGMSLDEMKLYLLADGESLQTAAEQDALLQEHKLKIKAQMEHLQVILDLIDFKLESGEKLGIKPGAAWTSTL